MKCRELHEECGKHHYRRSSQAFMENPIRGEESPLTLLSFIGLLKLVRMKYTVKLV